MKLLNGMFCVLTKADAQGKFIFSPIFNIVRNKKLVAVIKIVNANSIAAEWCTYYFCF